MEALHQTIQKLLEAQPHRFVFSVPRKECKFRRGTITQLKDDCWQRELLDDTKAYHHNFAAEQLPQELAQMMQQWFTQMTAFSVDYEISLRVTKKGRVLYNVRKGGAPALPMGHDREKAHIIPEGVVVPPLVDLGVMDAQGRILAAKRDKYRQINRFIELVDDVVRQNHYKTLHVVDFGCGKSYLTFLLYYYLTELQGIEAHITGLDLKADVVNHCNQAAAKYGYHNLRFSVGDIAQHQSGTPVDMVVTLHACDTATDYALAKAVGWQSKMIFSVPCCQHELNQQMQSQQFSLLTRYGIIKERTAALMTDAIRANLLVAAGYSAQLLEFVDMEHTPKNIMIRAKLTRQTLQNKRQALDEVEQICRAFQLSPTLLSMLKKEQYL